MAKSISFFGLISQPLPKNLAAPSGRETRLTTPLRACGISISRASQHIKLVMAPHRQFVIEREEYVVHWSLSNIIEKSTPTGDQTCKKLKHPSPRLEIETYPNWRSEEGNFKLFSEKFSNNVFATEFFLPFFCDGCCYVERNAYLLKH